jgi:histone H3/H4
MALEDLYEDDSFHEAPPRQSLLPDLPEDADTATMNSLEFGRRAFSEDPRAMFTGRLSERFGDLNELGIYEEEYEIDGTFINRRPTIGPDQLLQQAIEEDMGDTEEIRALTGRRGGRPSDVDLGVFGRSDEPDEPTFRFTIPQRIRAADREEPPEDLQRQEDGDEDMEGGEIAGTYIDEDAGAGDDMDPTRIASDEEDVTGAHGIEGWESDPGVDDDAELQTYREEVSAMDRSLLTQSPERPPTKEKRPGRKRKELHISRSGHEYPSFPSATLKRLATGLLRKSHGGNARINKDTLAALGQATDWFFERVGHDLAAYAQHAGRKTIEDADMITLMKR